MLFTSTRHSVYRLAAIEGRPIPGVSTVPRSKRSADEKKRMENAVNVDDEDEDEKNKENDHLRKDDNFRKIPRMI